MSPGTLASVLIAACAWACFLPIGVKYLAFLGCGLACAVVLTRQRRWAELRRRPDLVAALAFWGFGLLSMAWSSASLRMMVTQLWLYGMLLVSPLIALACPPALARLALRQFAIASALVGCASTLAHFQLLPAGWQVWSSSIEAEGNQRIVTSLMLALGAALAVLHALSVVSDRRRERAAWLIAAALSTVGLALQDRRTGMVALPVLLAVLGLARLRSTAQRLGVILGIAALCGLAWQASPVVRAHLSEGLNEMRSYQSSDSVETSWGMRLRLAERTLQMVHERPVAGHGIGSWISQWQARVPPGLKISIHTTPHNEYLLVASQLGLIGIALLLWLLLGNAWRGWATGAVGHAQLLVWTAIAWTGFFNVVLRDSKFALPLLLLAGLAGAVTRARPSSPGA